GQLPRQEDHARHRGCAGRRVLPGVGGTVREGEIGACRATTAVLPEERPMTRGEHLWAIGYEDMGRAERVRAEITCLGERHCLALLDTAVVVRYPEGSVTLDGEPFVAPIHVGGHTLASFLAGLALAAPPLTGPAVGALVGRTGGAPAALGIS